MGETHVNLPGTSPMACPLTLFSGAAQLPSSTVQLTQGVTGLRITSEVTSDCPTHSQMPERGDSARARDPALRLICFPPTHHPSLLISSHQQCHFVLWPSEFGTTSGLQ